MDTTILAGDEWTSECGTYVVEVLRPVNSPWGSPDTEYGYADVRFLKGNESVWYEGTELECFALTGPDLIYPFVLTKRKTEPIQDWLIRQARGGNHE